ncbi:hypothetical protein D922_04381 [Enterococcus faecalis 06-MB-DW-09]|nr:hypothetical protein D922_04381 [Enterococcus faecalis 06-MB-DW-09]
MASFFLREATLCFFYLRMGKLTIYSENSEKLFTIKRKHG